MTREEALQAIKEKMDYYESDKRLRGAIETLIPELTESEDERIRKLLVWQVYRNIEDETNDLAQSVYDGIKGHDPDIEESIEDWKRCLAWLEKQKEQKPVEWSEDFEQNIRILLHDKLMWYSDDGSISTAVFIDDKTLKDIVTGIWFYVGKEAMKNPNMELPKQEWSDEDKEMLKCVIMDVESAKENYLKSTTEVVRQGAIIADKELAWLKSLRPSWKPSEEQMDALEAATVRYQSTGLESLYEDLKKL